MKGKGWRQAGGLTREQQAALAPQQAVGFAGRSWARNTERATVISFLLEVMGGSREDI